MAEGTSLLRMHTAYTRIVGSNPTVSARVSKKKATARWLFSFPASYSYSCTSFSSIPAFAFGPVLFLMTVSASATVRVLVKMWCECDRTDLFAGRTQGKDVMLLCYRE